MAKSRSQLSTETYEDLRAVVMKWATSRKIENERSVHDPADCNHAQSADWTPQGDWSDGTQHGNHEGTSHDVNYMYSKGKGAGKGKHKGARDLVISSRHNITSRLW